MVNNESNSQGDSDELNINNATEEYKKNKRELGEDHPDTLASLNNLAN